MASTSERFLTFDHTSVLRGVAIMLVILQHLGAQYGTRLLTPCGGIGVALFLFMSGFGLNESYKSKGLQRFWQKKLLRVWLPYFVFATFYWLVLASRFRWNGYLLDVACIKCYYWYVSFLLVQYILFYVTTRFCLSSRLSLLTLAGVFVLLWCSSLRAEQAFSFVAGVFVSTHIEVSRKVIGGKNSLPILLAALLCGLFFLVLKQIPAVRSFEGTPVQSIVQMLCKFPLAIFLVMVFYMIKPTAKVKTVLAFLGSISLELYLVHMQFLPIFSQGDFALMAAVFVVLSVAVAWAFYKFNNWYYRLLLNR